MSKRRKDRSAKRIDRDARRLARATAERERSEDSRALALFQRAARVRALASTEEPPEASARSLALPDTTEVLKKAPLERRALLIVNAKSGPSADSLLKVRDIAETLATYGIGVDVRVKLRKSIARRDARKAARAGYPLVIAAGGDGTVAAVARGLLGTDAVLGIVPLGTYNNTASSLGIPADLSEACALIAAGTTRRVDVGEVRATGMKRSVPFLEVGGVGLAAALAPVGQHLEKGRWDSARDALPAALEMEPTIVSMQLDGSGWPRQARTLLLMVANGPRIGAGMTIAPEARMDDGLLDVQVYEDLDQAALAARLVAFEALATPLADGAERIRAREIRITSATPLPVVADSKVIGLTPAIFRVLPGALRVVAGNGPGLNRPVPDALVAATANLAHARANLVEAAAPDNPLPALGAEDKPVAVRALATVVPVAGQALAAASGVRPRAMPLAAAVAAGALAWPILRAILRRR